MAKKKSRGNKFKAKKTLSVEFIQQKIRQLFETNPGQTFSIRQIINKTGIRDLQSKELAFNVVMDMADDNEILKLRNNSFRSKAEAVSIVGRVDHVNKRFAYVISEDAEEDIWVKTEDLKSAIDGDIVSVQLKASRNGKKVEGKVIDIVERKKKEFVGRIEIMPRYAFVVPDNRKIHIDVFVYPEKIGKAKHNDKVIVKIKEWHGGSNKNPIGEVKEILGKAGENETEIHSIMAEFDLPFRFPSHIEQEAEKIPELIEEDEIKKRKDFRKTTTFTIDPVDAKDFDDAISLKKLKNGNFEIGVHIADVSHYVKPGSILDKEAVERATSVYLVDRTIPMLPEKLSNGVCSLRPNEDKLTFAAVFEITPEAEIKKHWFGRTVIHSDRRFAYEEAQERIESNEGDFAKEINTLNALAKLFKKQRFAKGAINFETVEVKFQLDENGKPLGIIPRERKDAHKLVEEFMLLANKYVAEHVFGLHKGEDTFVYRTHDAPDPEKLEAFSKFAVRFGHKLNMVPGKVSSSLNTLMDDIKGKPEQNVLESLAIRSMAKAKYTTDPKMHFGLAFPHYTHFTSPIRRYPDVMVHRLLQHYIDKQKSPDPKEYNELCLHSSEREKRAADAERASIKYKQVEFMASVENKPFEGIVSGITEWGVFVEITETKCEGMVRISDMDDDYYEYDDKNYCLVGKRNRKVITLGDKVTVVVIKTDINRRTIDLEFVEVENEDEPEYRHISF
ncbi:ribonuclease R [Reichenbachiella sp. MALMAid0571]|uniref:ribonuclease R n=1 Tax=Reichenbachiella sp. MALMAid0571 TaxID=3143939 RepID=UPI0032E0350E